METYDQKIERLNAKKEDIQRILDSESYSGNEKTQLLKWQEEVEEEIARAEQLEKARIVEAERLADLKWKRENVGNPGLIQRFLIELGWAKPERVVEWPIVGVPGGLVLYWEGPGQHVPSGVNFHPYFTRRGYELLLEWGSNLFSNIMFELPEKKLLEEFGIDNRVTIILPTVSGLLSDVNHPQFWNSDYWERDAKEEYVGHRVITPYSVLSFHSSAFILRKKQTFDQSTLTSNLLQQKIWKKIVVGGKTPEQLLAKLGEPFHLSYSARDMFKYGDFTPHSTVREIKLSVITPRGFGFNKPPTYPEWIKAINEHESYFVCPLEAGPFIRLAYPDQPIGEWLHVTANTPPGRLGEYHREVFLVGCDIGGMWLGGYQYGSTLVDLDTLWVVTV